MTTSGEGDEDPQEIQQCEFAYMTDEDGWKDPAYHTTIQVASTGGRSYLFGRGSDHLHLCTFDHQSRKWEQLPPFAYMRDSDGWNRAKYYSTLRVVASAGKIYVFGRGEDVLHLAAFDTTSRKWEKLAGFSFMSDKQGWGKEQYYSTIRVVENDGNIYVFGRGSETFHLAAFNVNSKEWAILPGFNFMGDDGGWDDPELYTTIQVVTAGGKIYVFGRGRKHLHLAAFGIASKEWEQLPLFEFLGDTVGWGNPKYYSTIRVVTSSGGIYVFGRGKDDLHLAEFDTLSQKWNKMPGLHFMQDKAGWGNPAYHSTIRVVANSGKIYVLGRGSSNIHLAAFDTFDKTWRVLPGLMYMSDAAQWSQPQYYNTIRVMATEGKICLFGRGKTHIHGADFEILSKKWE